MNLLACESQTKNRFSTTAFTKPLARIAPEECANIGPCPDSARTKTCCFEEHAPLPWNNLEKMMSKSNFVQSLPKDSNNKAGQCYSHVICKQEKDRHAIQPNIDRNLWKRCTWRRSGSARRSVLSSGGALNASKCHTLFGFQVVHTGDQHPTLTRRVFLHIKTSLSMLKAICTEISTHFFAV